ncbi:hypothetical protein [Spiroplasma tabanidicola]|uniref:Integrase catalytic domain-containing protein n=1 Tax=Spiroplasma tabanidicola TaxID=324079 RepID=A0A6I6C5S7_9MOLU|nr:hypothetical protein [Spiroplasma tabanidicola]QGS51490.1 hypothetical protein STABA_v1c01230 [Spiroplasma tabanidicola]
MYNQGLDLKDLPSFRSPIYDRVVEIIKDYNDANNMLASGSDLIRKWIFINKSIRVFEKLVRKIRKDVSNILKKANRVNKTGYFKESKKHNSYVRNDLIEMNYKTPNVVGIDGTNFKIFLNNSKSITKLSCLISYDWLTRTIVNYKFDQSENSVIALYVIQKINNYAIQNKLKKIIQSDRGLAFSNESIFYLC